MTYGIMLGSNMFVGTTGIMTVEQNSSIKEFFRVREIDRSRSDGSYIVIDCDIKDVQGNREVKLFKSRPVAGDAITVDCSPGMTRVRRQDGSDVIVVEIVDHDDVSLPQQGPVTQAIRTVNTILRITGDFFAGPHHLRISPNIMHVGSIALGGNLFVGTGGMHLTQMGFAM